MNAKLRALALGLSALVALAGAPRPASGAEALAVLPVAEPPGPEAPLVELAGELRAALAAHGAGGLSPDALRSRMTGTAPAAALAAADAAYQAALDVHAKGDFEGSIRALRDLLEELDALPSGGDVQAHRRRAMLRLARSEQAVGRRSEAEAVLQRLLRAEPSLAVDARLYPPGFQRLVEDVRAELRALWTRRLAVESRPGVRVLVEGREVGEAPLTLELPPGRYRVAGVRGGIRSRELTVDLSNEDRRVELDLSLAELLEPERGPGLALPRAARTGRMLAVAHLLDLDRVVSVWTDARREQPDRTWVAAAIHDARRGTSSAEGRVQLAEGKLPAGGAQALAAFLLTGEASPLVEVVPVASLDAKLPSLAAPRRGPLAWDGVKRPAARKYGWWATGSGLAALALGAVAVTQSGAASGAYADARSMQDGEGGVAYGFTVGDYNAAIRRGDRARSVAAGAGIGAGALAVSSVVLGLVSYHRTGEVGPIRF